MPLRVRSHNRRSLVEWNRRMLHDVEKPYFDKVAVALLHKGGASNLEYKARNLYKVDAIREILELYSPEHSFSVNFSDDRVRSGRDFAFRCLARPESQDFLHPVRLDGDISQLFSLLNINGEASAGLTNYGFSKGESFTIAMRKIPQILQGKAIEPCLAGVRTQEDKFGRLIWMYPFTATILEGTLARPLTNKFKGSFKTPFAFGKRSALLGVEMRRAASHNDYYVSMDASKFDTTISYGVIKSAFAALRTWFDPNEEVGFGKTVSDIFDLVEDYFIHTPIVMPDASGPKLYTGKRHGVPSGSYFTQIVDSFANLCLIGTLSFTYNLSLRTDEVWVLGDDMLFFSKKKPDLQVYANLLSELYGMRMNAVKSLSGSVTEPYHFIGRTWINGLPFREFAEVAKKSIAPERPRKYQDVDRDGRLVLHSYRNSAFVKNAPVSFFTKTRTYKSGKQKFHSGYMEYLAREGEISSLPSEVVY